ncbi:translation initiation factor IF-2-like [Mustela putorius furo]|uniref:Translation initiation factor IF-2-like n=1 Tax=Mustela putorius furo TaxID=9669 RepID=A0A8U0S015_MUSPF|nr:translation initiation factor IF-2-like [Mustela putorius furo]
MSSGRASSHFRGGAGRSDGVGGGGGGSGGGCGGGGGSGRGSPAGRASFAVGPARSPHPRASPAEREAAPPETRGGIPSYCPFPLGVARSVRLPVVAVPSDKAVGLVPTPSVWKNLGTHAWALFNSMSMTKDQLGIRSWNRVWLTSTPILVVCSDISQEAPMKKHGTQFTHRDVKENRLKV